LADYKNNGEDDLLTKVFNRWICPAKFTFNNAAAKKSKNIADVTLSTKNWWCSDGSYNLTDDDTYATKGAAATSNSAVWATTAGNAILDKTQLLEAADDQDRRDELMLQACRQKRLVCGDMRVKEDAALTDSNRERKVAGNATGGFSALEKCTWALRSKTKAPTFVIGNTTKDK
jgi:hypothetical protein